MIRMHSHMMAARLPTILLGTALAACHGAPVTTTSAPVSTPAATAAPAVAAPPHPVTDTRPDSARHGYTAADVRFMQHMIHHHAQALAMTALVPARTGREDMRLLAERISVSQHGEIALMRRWLLARGEEAPDPAAHDMSGHDMAGHDMGGHQMAMSPDSSMTATPGMMTPAQMAQLAAATGPEFERLFLEGMIRHHEGALVMVGDLFAAPGAAQEPALFRLANDVDADQQAEIARMRALLASLSGAPRR